MSLNLHLSQDIWFHIIPYNPYSIASCSREIYKQTKKLSLYFVLKIQRWFRRVRYNTEKQFDKYIRQYSPCISKTILIRIYMLKYQFIAQLPELVLTRLNERERLLCRNWLTNHQHIGPYYRTAYFLKLPYIRSHHIWYENT